MIKVSDTERSQAWSHRVCIEVASLIVIARQDMKLRCSLCPLKLEHTTFSGLALDNLCDLRSFRSKNLGLS